MESQDLLSARSAKVLISTAQKKIGVVLAGVEEVVVEEVKEAVHGGRDKIWYGAGWILCLFKMWL
jgi:hypothetical protein